MQSLPCSCNRLADAREEFFEKYQPPLLRIQYDALKSETERMLSELCKFLHHVPTAEQRQNAMKLVSLTNDDLCYMQEIIRQPVQVVQGVHGTKVHGTKVQQRNPPSPSREKRKKKRKKR